MKKYPFYTWLLFIIPSLLGVFLFITPIATDNGFKVPIAMLANGLAGIVEPYIQLFTLIVFIIAALGSVIMHFIPKASDAPSTLLDSLFRVHLFWTTMRVLAVVFAVMYMWQIGPASFTSDNTAGVLIDPAGGLITFMFTLFFFAGLLLPLLTNFGLLEFFGSLMVRVMRPLFKIPGRSAIDALASWVGDGTIGVLLTAKQYEEKNYTGREAAIIATTFSVVSITFCLFVLETIGLDNYFFQFYGAVLVTGLILAFIMPRIFPLRNKANTLIDGTTPAANLEDTPEHLTMVSHGTEKALGVAHSNRNLFKILTGGFKNVLEMWFAVAPIIMAFGTIALVLAEFTNVFRILGMPFEPILALLQIPEASEAAQTMVVGFADMLLPSILGAGIESELTRFFIATISVTQLIYMSEVGGLILGTKLPLKIWDLFFIFLIRTIISIPIVAAIAHILF